MATFIYGAESSTGNIPLFDPSQYSSEELAASTLNDNIPDVWKIYYGLSINDPSVTNADYTGSGVMNREKYQLNIYPLAPAEPPSPPQPPDKPKNPESATQLSSFKNGTFTEGVSIGNAKASGGFSGASFN